MSSNTTNKNNYKTTLFRAGIFASLFMVTLIPVQIACFIIWPHPTNIIDWFKLFHNNWIVGLLSFDLLYMLSMIASIFLYIALYVGIYDQHKALKTFAIIIGLVGLTLYFPSNTSIEMLAMSEQYFKASTEQEKNIALASGNTLYAIWKGTSYSVYYVMNGVALILFFLSMRGDTNFRKSTARIGLTSGLLMTVPATAGVIGMTMALLSLIPWSIFSILVIKDFRRLNRTHLK